MQTEKSNKKKVDKQEIQRNVMHLALVIFFVATVSAAGGFLQGQQVAVDGARQVASINPADIAKGFFSNNNLFQGNPIGGLMQRFIPGANGTNGINPQNLIKDAIGRIGGQNRNNSTNNSTNNPQAPTNQNAVTSNNPPLPTLSPGTTPTCGAGSKDPKCLDRCSTTYIAHKSVGNSTGSPFQVKACVFDNKSRDPVAIAITKVEQTCKGKFEDIWKARGCSVDPSKGPDGAAANQSPTRTPVDSTDIGIYFEINTGIQAAAVILAEDATPAGTRAPFNAQQQNADNPGSNPPTWSANSAYFAGLIRALPVNKRSACREAVSKFDTAVKKSLSDAKTGAATGADVAICKYKGAVDCFQTGARGAGEQKYECKPKSERSSAPAPPPGNQPPAVVQPPPGNQQPPAAPSPGPGSMPSPPSAPSSPGGSPTPSNTSCPEGYVREGGTQANTATRDNEGGFFGNLFGSSSNNSSNSSSAGKCVKKDEKKDEEKPQCLIVASKDEIKAGETVTIRWRTANAEKIEIEGIEGSDLSKNSQKSVTPTETTTYKLTATGKGDNNTKTCEVEVKVDGKATGPTGNSPPKISCKPTTIVKGKSAAVKWACPVKADSSVGTGIDTEGKMSGEITIQPSHNTEYSVACLDEDKEEIGKDSCSVNVGEAMYDIVVHPTTAKRGDRVRISWASLFMKSCRVQGPRGFDYTRDQGVVITEPFSLDEERVPNKNIRAAIYSIECESQFGARTTRDVTVRFAE